VEQAGQYALVLRRPAGDSKDEGGSLNGRSAPTPPRKGEGL